MSDLNQKFISACLAGRQEEIEYCLLNKTEKVDIHVQDDMAIYLACFTGNFFLVKFLLTSPLLQEHANVYAKNNRAWLAACLYKDLDIIHFLLTSAQLKTKVDIHCEEEIAILSACQGNHYDLVDYFLSSPKLTEHANIHAQNDKVFKTLLREQNITMIKYLIFKHDIKKTQSITQYIMDEPLVEKIFEAHDDYARLKEDLCVKNFIVPKNKL